MKENKGRFFLKSAVDLYVLSKKGAIKMKTIQEEKYEYDKFVIELSHKLHDIQQDFDKLSDENKIRFENTVSRVLLTKGILGVLDYLNQWR